MPAAHEPTRHMVLVLALRQAVPPLPSQPPGEQTAFSAVPAGHTPLGSMPVGTGVQVPTMRGSAHDSQPAVHARSQHTPSAQKLDAHSAPCTQVAPGPLRPHEPFTQLLPSAHWVPSVQALQQVVASLHL